MRRSGAGAWLAVMGVTVVVAGGLTWAGERRPTAPHDDRSATASRVVAGYGDLPLTFEPNVGQAPATAGFVARGGGYTVSLAPTSAVLALRRAGPEIGTAVVGATLVGADPDAAADPGDPLAGRVNYLPADAAARRTDVATYGRVTYREVYPGVDVVYYGRGGQLEYDFVLEPGADPSPLRVAFSGVDSLDIDGRGDLVMGVGGGTLVQHAPVAYQDLAGVRRPVDAAYVRIGATDVGLRLGAYDAGQALVVDPVLAYSTYLGGSSLEESTSIAVDASGSAYVVGSTNSNDYPVTPGVVQPVQQPSDMVITKLSPGGNALVYSTYLGGSNLDYGNAIAVDPDGNAYVTGKSGSTDFPVVNALQPAPAGEFDAVVVKLDPTGSAIVYSTFLGGTGVDQGNRIEVDASRRAVVAGLTYSADFPTVNALQPTFGGAGDTFLTRLTPSGSALASSTFLGGSQVDEPYGLDLDGAGTIVVGGETSSDDFPVHNAFQPTSRGFVDGYITRIDPTATSLIYSTYIGGSGYTVVYDVAVDQAGNAHAVGETSSPDFPLVRPLQTAASRVFVAKLGPTGAVVFSTYLGQGLAGTAIDVDPASGRIWVTGDTAATTFPTVAPIQAANAGDRDAFVSALAPDGSALVFSTYLGGTGRDFGHAIAVDPSGAAYVVGHTLSTDFPTRNAFDATFAPSTDQFPSQYDLFVAKIVLQDPAVVGSTWHSNGASTRSGPASTPLMVFATGAFQNVPYLLVLSTDATCTNVTALLNPTTRFAGSSGLIGTTRGTVPAGTPPGAYRICFREAGGATATAAATFTVT